MAEISQAKKEAGMSAVPVLKVQLMLKGRPIKSYTFAKNEITIGRDPEADVFLDNMGVSRQHARFYHTPQGFFVEDLGSSNGTYINGEAHAREPLSDSDTVKVGKFDLIVSLPDTVREMRSPTEAAAAPVEAEGTMVLTTDQLARVMRPQSEPEARPILKLVEHQAPPARQQGSLHTTQFWIAWIVTAFVGGAAIGAFFALYWG